MRKSCDKCYYFEGYTDEAIRLHKPFRWCVWHKKRQIATKCKLFSLRYDLRWAKKGGDE